MDAKEEKIRKITQIYYSKPEVQKAIFSFSQNREIVPRYFEGFGKRPDSIQYPTEILELARNGATSFHCSEEIWKDPLRISTSMNSRQINDLRTGWDLLIDIDCKYFDFSKKAAEAVISVFKKHKIKNFGIKYSGSKGFHLIIPWKSFPKNLRGEETKNLFPELPRKIISYIRLKSESELMNSLSEDDLKNLENSKIRKGRKCKICREIADEYRILNYTCQTKNCVMGGSKEEGGSAKKIPKENLAAELKKNYYCPECNKQFHLKSDFKDFYECKKCGKNSLENPGNFSKYDEKDLFELMGLDLILVSPRHLFRAPYSLHEKTALASVVISEKELKNFQPKDANPVKVEIADFIPNSEENEASDLVNRALEWHMEKNPVDESEKKISDFKPIKIEKLSDSFLPPSVQKILLGIDDGKKRALFILINLFRSIGMEKEELEKRIYDWNKKNKLPLKEGYVKSQIIWSYRNKIVLPPNFDKDYYRAIGVVPTEEELRLKNPVNYVVQKSKKNKNFRGSKDNFKN